MGRSGKGLITSLGLNNNIRPNKNKNARYAITNISMKYLSKIIKEFENFPYKGYVRKIPKHEPTDSYFYLARQLAKCTMRADAFNSHVGPARTEMTGTQQITILHVCDLDERKSKEILAEQKLSQVCSTDKGKSESVIDRDRS